MTPETIAAYAAGFFDGEGYVDIYSASLAKASKSPSLMLRVVISQKDGKVMNWLTEHFGGHVQLSRKGQYSIYRWDIRSQAAKRFLLAILPYVLVKKEQVILAIEYEQRKETYLYNQKGSKGFNRLTEEEIQWRMETKEKLKALKKNYVVYTKNSAPPTTKRNDPNKGM